MEPFDSFHANDDDNDVVIVKNDKDDDDNDKDCANNDDESKNLPPLLSLEDLPMDVWSTILAYLSFTQREHCCDNNNCRGNRFSLNQVKEFSTVSKFFLHQVVPFIPFPPSFSLRIIVPFQQGVPQEHPSDTTIATMTEVVASRFRASSLRLETSWVSFNKYEDDDGGGNKCKYFASAMLLQFLSSASLSTPSLGSFRSSSRLVHLCLPCLDCNQGQGHSLANARCADMLRQAMAHVAKTLRLFDFQSAWHPSRIIPILCMLNQLEHLQWIFCTTSVCHIYCCSTETFQQREACCWCCPPPPPRPIAQVRNDATVHNVSHRNNDDNQDVTDVETEENDEEDGDYDYDADNKDNRVDAMNFFASPFEKLQGLPHIMELSIRFFSCRPSYNTHYPTYPPFVDQDLCWALFKGLCYLKSLEQLELHLPPGMYCYEGWESAMAILMTTQLPNLRVLTHHNSYVYSDGTMRVPLSPDARFWHKMEACGQLLTLEELRWCIFPRTDDDVLAMVNYCVHRCPNLHKFHFIVNCEFFFGPILRIPQLMQGLTEHPLIHGISWTGFHAHHLA